MNKLICFVLFCVCSVFAQTSSAAVPRFDAMYVFGDSLSDTGNDLILTKLLIQGGRLPPPAIPPSESPHRTYYEGRFSNGPISFEYLWRLIKKSNTARVVPSLAFAQPANKGAVNYAFGGATSGFFSATPGEFTVPGLRSQVEAFRFGLFGRKPIRGALYAIWIGSNDYATLTPNPPEQVVSNIKLSIQRLYQIGGRNFIVLNMPDLGQTPAAQSQPGLPSILSGLSASHNLLLAEAVTALSTLPAIKITSINVFTLAEDLARKLDLLDPLLTLTKVPALEFLTQGLSLSPPASLCLLLNPASCPDLVSLTPSELPPFFYWDVEHPTTFVHGVLGAKMYEALQ